MATKGPGEHDEQALFHDLPTRRRQLEHLKETFYALASAYSHFAHKNGKQLSELCAGSLAAPDGETSCGRSRSCGTIADHIHFHPVYLSKLYKQETGETISDYIHRTRMEKAVQLLRETDLKVYEVAQLVGYENTYFNKVFKKQFGVTPQEFRGG